MSKNTSGGVPASPVPSSPESSTGCMSPPGGGGAKLTPAPAGLVSQIPGQQGKFAGYGIGLHGPLHGAGQHSDQYQKPAAPAQGSWARPGPYQGHGWAGSSTAEGRPSYGASSSRLAVPDSPVRPAPSRLPGSSATPSDHCYTAFTVELDQLRRRVMGMHQAMDKQTQLPQNFIAAVKVDLVEMLNVIEGLPVNVFAMGKMLKELEQEIRDVKFMFVQQTTQNEAARNSSQNRIIELEDKIRELMDQNTNTQAKLAGRNMQHSADQDTIRRLQEQIDGKRNLWMQMHPEPQERALALAYHGGARPAATSYGATSLNPESAAATSTNWRPQGSNTAGHQKAPSTARSISTPLKGESRFQEPRFAPSRQPYVANPDNSFHRAPAGDSNVHRAPAGDSGFHRAPAGPGLPLTASNVATFLGSMNLSSTQEKFPTPKAEAGSPLKLGKTPKSAALQDDLNLAAKAPFEFWADNLRKLWALALGFCTSYVTPDHVPDVPAFVQGKAPRIWDNIAASLYPRDPKARDAAWQTISELLRDVPSRSFLAERLIVQHILQEIFRPSGWLGFDMQVDEEFQRIQKELDECASFKPHDRLLLLERRSNLVLSMLDDSRWDQFRHTKVNEHFQALKQAIWALAPDGKARTEMREDAHFDLFSLLELAWELATKMYLARADFYFSWPDVGDKFDTNAHADLAVEYPRSAAAVAAAKAAAADGYNRFGAGGGGRVRVAVTPGVLMRKLEGMRIQPKSVLKANVLVG